jgi:hypothetical protein
MSDLQCLIRHIKTLKINTTILTRKKWKSKIPHRSIREWLSQAILESEAEMETQSFLGIEDLSWSQN